jgi:hypothetical protein
MTVKGTPAGYPSSVTYGLGFFILWSGVGVYEYPTGPHTRPNYKKALSHR